MALSTNPIISEILRQGRGKPRRHILAALETGRIESNFTNPSGGDQDSAGWRQERRSLYKNPTNVRASVRRFYQEAASLDRGQAAHELAADVQRPREDLRYKYRTARGEARAILGGGRTARDLPTPEAGMITTSETRFDQEGYQKALRGATLARLLSKRPEGSVLLRTGLLSTQMPERSEFVSKVVGERQVGGTTPVPGMPARGGRTRASGGVKYVGADPSRLTPAIKRFAEQVAAISGEDITADTGATHSKYTVNGRISQHWSGNATDIPATGKLLLKLGRSALIAAGMPRKEAMKAKGGLYNVRGRQIIFLTNEGGNHFDHLHIGN